MEKVDRVVALVGALVLVGALGFAATQEDDGLAYAVAYVPTEVEPSVFDFPSGPLPSTGAQMEVSFSYAGNLSLVEVNFTLAATAATAGSVRATLEDANGTILDEKEVAVPAASQTPVVLSLSALVTPIPEPAMATYPTEEAARGALAPPVGGSDYKVTFAYSPGLAPAAQASVQHEIRLVGWVGVVAPVVPESR